MLSPFRSNSFWKWAATIIAVIAVIGLLVLLLNGCSTTPAATPTPTPAAPEPTVGSATCPTEAEFAQLTGVVADKVPTEPCAFHWRGDPLAITPAKSCPQGWSCQLGVVSQGNILYYGGNPSVTIYAGTWRLVEGYPSNDAVQDPCRFLAKSQEEGRAASPQWTITAGNFSCP